MLYKESSEQTANLKQGDNAVRNEIKKETQTNNQAHTVKKWYGRD
jgi:hypothetical protein